MTPRISTEYAWRGRVVPIDLARDISNSNISKILLEAAECQGIQLLKDGDVFELRSSSMPALTEFLKQVEVLCGLLKMRLVED